MDGNNRNDRKKRQQEVGSVMRAARNANINYPNPLVHLQKTMSNITDLAKLTNPLIMPNSYFGEFNRSIEQITKPFSHLKRSIDKFRTHFEDVIANASPAYRKAALKMAQHGWYLDMDMVLPLPVTIADSLSSGDVAAAEADLAYHFENSVDRIQYDLVVAYPKRERLISSAFGAHRSGQYELSIPVLLSQADGICFDVTGTNLFSSRSATQLASYANRSTKESFSSALLAPLGEKLPIGFSSSERGDGWTELNRHMVMHGESVDYGTKTNSLKAISLVNYVGMVLKTDDAE